eukprot:10091-Rhodomonas_salina.1
MICPPSVTVLVITSLPNFSSQAPSSAEPQKRALGNYWLSPSTTTCRDPNLKWKQGKPPTRLTTQSYYPRAVKQKPEG